MRGYFIIFVHFLKPVVENLTANIFFYLKDSLILPYSSKADDRQFYGLKSEAILRSGEDFRRTTML